MTVWMVRAGKYGQDEDAALEEGRAIIGWEGLPDLSRAKSREDLHEVYRLYAPDETGTALANQVGQLFAFLVSMQAGDIVALPLKSRAQVALGKVKGPYQYVEVRGRKRHTRPVEWVRPDVPRTDIGQDMLYSLGSLLTICRIQRNNAEARFSAIIKGMKDSGPADTVTIEEVTRGEDESFVDVELMARDQIVGHLEKQFKGHALARLVEAVLQAEGYVTRLSPPGPDGGADILAGRGVLGFEQPRICVQVKSSSSPADVTIFRTLQGTMQSFSADQGLLVCWGGFKRSVEQEARQSFFTVRL